jgi:hypothetical protein
MAVTYLLSFNDTFFKFSDLNSIDVTQSNVRRRHIVWCLWDSFGAGLGGECMVGGFVWFCVGLVCGHCVVVSRGII